MTKKIANLRYNVVSNLQFKRFKTKANKVITPTQGLRYSKLEAENEELRKELEMTRLERDAVNKSLNVIASRILITIID